MIVEFTRAFFPNGRIYDVAHATAEAIKAIVGGHRIQEKDGNIAVIKKDDIAWTLYPPGNFTDQAPMHWRLTVETLKNEHSDASPGEQKMLEEDLVHIMAILMRYH